MDNAADSAGACQSDDAAQRQGLEFDTCSCPAGRRACSVTARDRGWGCPDLGRAPSQLCRADPGAAARWCRSPPTAASTGNGEPRRARLYRRVAERPDRNRNRDGAPGPVPAGPASPAAMPPGAPAGPKAIATPTAEPAAPPLVIEGSRRRHAARKSARSAGFRSATRFPSEIRLRGHPRRRGQQARNRFRARRRQR